MNDEKEKKKRLQIKEILEKIFNKIIENKVIASKLSLVLFFVVKLNVFTRVFFLFQFFLFLQEYNKKTKKKILKELSEF
jgi:hypothetical protein